MSPSRVFLIVLGIWALIYLPGLGTLEIKGEEGRRILPAVTMLKTGNFIVPQIGSDPYFTKPPLINWLVALSFKLTGRHNEWSARLPSVLCVLAVALAFITVGRGVLGANGSLIAALVWMTNFGMIEKGRLIEIEALYVSLAGLAFICWLSWWLEGRSPWLVWIVPWIFLGLGLLAKGPLHLVFFYAVVIALLFRAGELRRLGHPAHFLGLALMLGLFAAWAIPCLKMMEPGNVAHTWTRQFSGRLSGEDFNFAGWIMNIPRGLGYFLPWTLLFLFVRRAPATNGGTGNIEAPLGNSKFDVRRSTFDVSVGLAWGIAISFLVVSLLPGSLPRYTMPLLVPASWLVATILTSNCFELRAAMRLPRPASLPFELRWPIVISGLVCSAIVIYAVALMPVLRKFEKIRTIAAQIDALRPAGEPLYVIDPDYQPALFYLREPIVYLSRLEEIPITGRYFLVQPALEDEVQEKDRPILRLRDYRKKELILFWRPVEG